MQKERYCFSDYLLVRMEWSKTIQFGNRKLELPLVKIKESPLCPYNAYNRMCTLIPADGDKPAFLIPQSKGYKTLCYSFFQKRLRDILEMCGLNSSKFSSHSFRRGGATWAFHSKVPSELIQFHGDWRSDAYKVYLEFDLQDKLSISRAMADEILN
ncbi:unnamed protein product [Mytilus edulis]|uniref:Tyr recombinase domain-containing protein n=1 Tax=Mytilus edulis TaxID=6550 RepID=A0A8S3RMS7_MYTED|nr:unnamed protein product [Mytilus edulis]